MQPSYEITTSAYARSYQESVYVRPTDSVDVIANYFLPGVAGGDHALKFGFKYRNDMAYTGNQWGGNAIAQVPQRRAESRPISTAESVTEYGLHNRNFYVQDSYTRKKLTVNLGLRFDHQSDFADPNTAPASPFFGKATYAGRLQRRHLRRRHVQPAAGARVPGREHRHRVQELVAAHRRHLRPAG